MKIAILTQPFRTNYGAILQNFALQKVLCDLGIENVTIETTWKLKLSLVKMPYLIACRIYNNIFKNSNLPLLYEKKYNNDYPLFCKNTRSFISKHIKTITISNLNKDISPSSYDGFIVGSDQVWRPKYNKDIYNMFLDFAYEWKTRRISYAASFGTNEWEFSKEQTKKCKDLICRFNAISVREDSGVDLCDQHLNVRAVSVLDPTLLLDQSVYESLIPKGQLNSKGNFFIHILDNTPDKLALSHRIATDFQLHPFTVNHEVDELNLKQPISKRVQPPVEQWLQAFVDAKVVLTDSFHACVFSIIFNKPFIVIGNKERGMARFYSLLEKFNLTNSLITEESEYLSSIIEECDFSDYNSTIQQYKDKSIGFLINALFV